MELQIERNHAISIHCTPLTRTFQIQKLIYQLHNSNPSMAIQKVEVYQLHLIGSQQPLITNCLFSNLSLALLYYEKGWKINPIMENSEIRSQEQNHRDIGSSQATSKGVPVETASWCVALFNIIVSLLHLNIHFHQILNFLYVICL